MSNEGGLPGYEGVIASPSNSSGQSSTHPSLRQKKLKELVNTGWLRAHRADPTLRDPHQHVDPISISDDSLHPITLVDDLESIYQAGDLSEGLQRTNDLLH